MNSTDPLHERIAALLMQADIPHRFHTHAAAITDADAEALLPFPAGQRVKTVVFRVSEQWVLVAVRGSDRVDYKRLATALGVKRDALRLPEADAVTAALGYAMGGVCPLFVQGEGTVLFDSHVPPLGTVFCGAGEPGARWKWQRQTSCACRAGASRRSCANDAPSRTPYKGGGARGFGQRREDPRRRNGGNR